MIKYFIFISICFAANPIDKWIDANAEILKHDIKSISFQLKIYSELFNIPEDSIISGKITVGKKKQFRFEMGPRTIVSDGIVWKSYDKRSNQIFIQKPDKQLEKLFFVWTKYKRMKALPVKLEEDGGYRLKLMEETNGVRAYFHPDSGELKSIKIVKSDIKSEITWITLASEKILKLDIGNKNTEIFDMR